MRPSPEDYVNAYISGDRGSFFAQVIIGLFSPVDDVISQIQ